MKIRKGPRPKFPLRYVEPELVNIWFKNFKAFGDWVKIPIRPITVIFGKNSAGKSSIMHAFLWLREISENGFLDIRTTAKSGDFVDLGGMQSYVHANQERRADTVGYKLDLEDAHGQLNKELKDLFRRFYEKLPSMISDTNESDSKRIEEAQKELQKTNAEDKVLSFLSRINKIEITVEFNLGDAGKTNESDDEKPQPAIHLKVNGVTFCSLVPAVRRTKETFYGKEKEDIKYEFQFPNFFFDELQSEIEKVANIFYPDFKFGKVAPFQGIKLYLKEVENAAVWTDWNDNFNGTRIYPSRRLSGIRYGREDFDKPNDDNEDEISKNKQFNKNTYKILRGVMGEIYLPWIKKLLEIKKRILGSILEDLNYLPAIRKYPGRIISENSLSTNLFEEIYGNKSIRLLFKNPSIVQKLNNACRSLGAKFTFKIEKKYQKILGKTLSILSISNGDELSFRDIGFGWSQVFPVLVEILADSNSFILIEQPELHLHPSAQSELMLLIINEIMESEINKKRQQSETLWLRRDRKQQVMLEAHSEQMVIKLLACFNKYSIKERDKSVTLGPQHCAILYVQGSLGSSSIQEIIPDENGNIGNQWPGGFFESAMWDLVKNTDEKVKG